MIMGELLVLNKEDTTYLFPKSPFNFDATLHKPSHFPDQLTIYEEGKFWQTIRIKKDIFGIRLENVGEIEKPKIKITIFSNSECSKEQIEIIKNELVWRYDLDANISEFTQKFKKDKFLGQVLKKWKGMRVSTAHSLYELLIIGIVLQNATVRRSVQMLNSLLEKYGRLIEFDKKKVYALWLPNELVKVNEQELRNLKVGYRAKFFIRLSNDFVEGKIDEIKLKVLPKEEAKKELTKLFGVGPETARILLFEFLHHYDVFDHIASWQQKIYSRLFYNKQLVPVEKIKKEILKRYGKWSMLAVHYIWEDLFWKRKNQHIEWLEKEIRL